MKKIFPIILLLVLLSLTNSEAKENTPACYNNTFGVKASNISGYGFCYQRKINNSFRLEISGLAYLYQWKDSSLEHKIFNYSTGVEFQFNMEQTDLYRLYLLAGGYYYYDDDDRENNKRVEKKKNSYNTGIGVGIEYSYKRIVYNFELGYKFYQDDSKVSENGGQSFPELKMETKPGAEIGIGFLF